VRRCAAHGLLHFVVTNDCVGRSRRARLCRSAQCRPQCQEGHSGIHLNLSGSNPELGKCPLRVTTGKARIGPREILWWVLMRAFLAENSAKTTSASSTPTRSRGGGSTADHFTSRATSRCCCWGSVIPNFFEGPFDERGKSFLDYLRYVVNKIRFVADLGRPNGTHSAEAALYAKAQQHVHHYEN
jgi:hypothetical protein